MRRVRRGAALLEVIVALTILSIAGGSALAVATQSAAAIGRVREKDAELRSASALLHSVVLWPREDLDRHLGTRRQGHMLMRVERSDQQLYTIVLMDSLGGNLLRTDVFRPESLRVQR